jgi:tetratricopeptide (TPR) repeat protein
MFNLRISPLVNVVLVVLFISGCSSMSLPDLPFGKGAALENVQQQPESAVSELPSSVVSAQPDSPALLLIKDKQWTKAEILLRAEVKRSPSNIAARTNLGLLYADTGRPSEAVALLSDLTRQHPDACAAQVKLAQLFRDAYRFSEAEAAYQACLSNHPSYPAALLNLGILYELYRGDFTAALVHYERYQASLPQPDLKVEGWIADLSRRSHQIAEAR